MPILGLLAAVCSLRPRRPTISYLTAPLFLRMDVCRTNENDSSYGICESSGQCESSLVRRRARLSERAPTVIVEKLCEKKLLQ